VIKIEINNNVYLYIIMSSLSRALPSRALLLINDYSRPITRPDWRTIKKITTFDLYAYSYRHLKILTPLMEMLIDNIHYTNWYNIYMTIKLYGIYKAIIKYNMTSQEILRIKGMSDAVAYHHFWGEEQ
jgi:hypothetical protein